MIINKLTTIENEFVAMIGISFFIIPYQTHNARPMKRITRKKMEISCAFFSLRSLISCGRREAEVKIPAAIPTQSVI
jgi:hypothetical protein